MKIFILYETYNIEFFGKYILGKYLISKIKQPIKVYVGFYRDLILKIYKCKPNEKVIIIGNQIYSSNKVLIDFYKHNNFYFYPQHEEEHSLFSVNKKNYLNNLITRKYFFRFKKYLCFNNETKKIFKNFLNLSDERFQLVGNAKYDFLDFLRKSKNFSKNLINYKNKYILVALPDSFFKNTLIYINERRENFEISINHKYDTTIGNRSRNEQISLYFYMKSFLKNISILAKKNKNYQIVLRPHPSDYEYLDRLKKSFKNIKNIKIDTNHQIYHWIKNSEFVICSPASPVIDSSILKKKVICFYDKSNKFHKFIFSKHPSLKFKKLRILKNFYDFSISNLKKVSSIPVVSSNILPPNKPHYKCVYEELNKINFQKKKINIFFHNLMFNKVIKFIESQKKVGDYGIKGAKKFNSKFRFSIQRFLVIIFFWNNPFKLDFLNILRKFTLGRSYTVANLGEWHGGLNQKIDTKSLIKFENYFKKIFKFFKKSKITIIGKKVVVLKKL